ncbi:MAG TPA: phosphoenolpyruvate synthase, partial [Bacteroidales bacterium]|nr:phosphoenolpyruvate synthase [Bacteroidales bacterium]
GIPVVWPQISNARVIVETSLEDFPLDASLGSHFFHNITSMNIGYFSVQHASRFDKIQWDVLKKLPETNRGNFVRQVSLPSPATVLMDGKKRISVIVLNGINHL